MSNLAKMSLWVCVTTFVIVASLSAGGAETCPAAATCPAAKGGEGADCGGEWKPLLNGTDLAGWQNARNAKAQNNWGIEDGALTNFKTGHDGNDIATVDSFKDFCLKLEYKTVKDGNSGVYLRGRVEVQVLDSFGKTPGKGDDGAIYDQFAPLVNASKPVGEWNQLEVMYKGNMLTVKLNGQVVQDKIKIVKPTGGALPGDVNEPGPLMLQGNHGKVWYRNIMIRPCPVGATCCAK